MGWAFEGLLPSITTGGFGALCKSLQWAPLSSWGKAWLLCLRLAGPVAHGSSGATPQTSVDRLHEFFPIRKDNSHVVLR